MVTSGVVQYRGYFITVSTRGSNMVVIEGEKGWLSLLMKKKGRRNIFSNDHRYWGREGVTRANFQIPPDTDEEEWSTEYIFKWSPLLRMGRGGQGYIFKFRISTLVYKVVGLQKYFIATFLFLWSGFEKCIAIQGEIEQISWRIGKFSTRNVCEKLGVSVVGIFGSSDP